MERTPTAWVLGLEGTSTNSDVTLVPRLQEFEASLTNSLFRVEITNSVTHRLFSAKAGAPRHDRTAARDHEGRPFFLEGTMR